jgi:NhaA family Na+:H+ antiporter
MQKVLPKELIGGILLFVAAVLALVIANSSVEHAYQAFLNTPVSVHIGGLGIDKPLLLWINDGLMVIFFLMISLEVKREFLEGELSSLSAVALPGIGALGGMIVPACIYFFFNRHDMQYIHGWAIPTATDIAFVLGVLALLGPRVSPGLRMFLLSLAIFDDIGAIGIIAIFYSHELSLTMLVGSLICLAILFMFNRRHVVSIMPYVLVGIVMWIFVLKSGVHATLTGVALGLMIPHEGLTHKDSPLKRMEYGLQPYVVYGIVPLFAFTNAGVALDTLQWSELNNTVTLGVALGLLLGKQLGVFSFVWLAIQCGFAKLPRRTTWFAMYGGAVLCGIGFTMSLFIASLSFAPGLMPSYAPDKLGILMGSTASGVIGYLLLRFSHRQSTLSADQEFVEEYTAT